MKIMQCGKNISLYSHKQTTLLCSYLFHPPLLIPQMLLYVRLQASCLHTCTQMPKDCDQTITMMTLKPQSYNLWWLEIIKSEYTSERVINTHDYSNDDSETSKL